MRKVCFFLGQRSPCGTQLPGLAAELTRHIEGYGVRDFVVGRYGAGARLAAEAVVMEKSASRKYVCCACARTRCTARRAFRRARMG